jgi:hypothetical protein
VGRRASELGGSALCVAQCMWQILCGCSYGRRMRIADVLCTVGQRTCTQPLASGGPLPSSSSYAAARRIGTSGSCLASLAGWLADAAAPRTRSSTPLAAEQHHDTPSSACSALYNPYCSFWTLNLAVYCAATLWTSHLLLRLPSQGWTSLPDLASPHPSIHECSLLRIVGEALVSFAWRRPYCHV